MKWHTEFRCVSCAKPVSFFVKMDSHGRCPHCGHKGKDAGTVMNTTEHVYRLVPTGAWWQFWKPKKRIYA